MTGSIDKIWIKTAIGGPMRSADRATLKAGEGLEGNANQGGDRQVVVMDAQRWKRAQDEAGVDLDPIVRRGNVLLSGLPLDGSVGKILQLGACRIHILGETHPCEIMDAAHPGLAALLRPDLGGGVYGVVLDGGEIALGQGASLEVES